MHYQRLVYVLGNSSIRPIKDAWFRVSVTYTVQRCNKQCQVYMHGDVIYESSDLSANNGDSDVSGNIYQQGSKLKEE